MPASFCGNCGGRLPEENLQQCPYCRTDLSEQRASNYGFPPHGIPPEGSIFYDGPTMLSSKPASLRPGTSRSAPPSAPPITPSSPGTSRLIIGILISVIVLLVLSSAIGAFVLTQRRGVTQVNSTATAQAQANATTTAQANSTATAQAQLNATTTAQAQANAPGTATATALQNIYMQATAGTPALSDPLSHQDSYNWDESANCAFVGGTYHASSSLTDNFFTCTPNAHSSSFGDFAFQVQMSIIHGDYGGMFFRANSTGTDYYTFTVDQSGQYSLDVYKNNNYLKTVSNGFSSVFTTGLNHSNLIIVVARGSTFYFYMNGQFVASGSDPSYGTGQIGLLAGDNTHPTEVAFSNLKIWSA
jgi:hypothetical protein